MTLVCLLAIGGGIAAYRFWGPGSGDGPQAANAGLQTPAPPVVASPGPKVAPEVAEWVNPAFKDITPEEAVALRTEFAESVVTQFFSVGDTVSEFTSTLASRKAPPPEPPADTTETKNSPEPPAAQPAPIPDFDASAFHVNGIMFNGADSMAIINGTVYRIGQTVSGVQIESITPKHVFLKIGEHTFKVGMQ
jgi:hypothetical protein